MDHDQLFKRLLTSFFKELMELFLPAEANAIDFDRMMFLEQEYFTDVSGGKRKQLDLVVQAGLKQGGEEFILVHVEFQARKQLDFPWRMFEYYMQLALRHKKPIIPVAIFADEAVWRKPVADHYEARFLDRVYVRFQYHLIKLKHYDYQDFLRAENPLAYALMVKMGYDHRQRGRLKADFLRWILGTRIDPARQSILLEFVENYMRLSVVEQNKFDSIVEKEKQYKEVKEMITVYEQRGIEKGIAKGMEKGIERGMKRGVLKGLDAALQKMIQSGISEAKARQILGIERQRTRK